MLRRQALRREGLQQAERTGPSPALGAPAWVGQKQNLTGPVQVKTCPREVIPSSCGVGRAQEEGNQEKVVL